MPCSRRRCTSRVARARGGPCRSRPYARQPSMPSSHLPSTGTAAWRVRSTCRGVTDTNPCATVVEIGAGTCVLLRPPQAPPSRPGVRADPSPALPPPSGAGIPGGLAREAALQVRGQVGYVHIQNEALLERLSAAAAPPADAPPRQPRRSCRRPPRRCTARTAIVGRPRKRPSTAAATVPEYSTSSPRFGPSFDA